MSSNPYESPKAIESASPQVPRSGKDLGWLLFSFQGRIPRRLYWAATLGATVAAAGAVVLLSLFAGNLDSNTAVWMLEFVLVWITFAVEVKRWHDRDKSGRWILVRFIPVVGVVWILIEAGCLRGTPGPNRYGPDPR